MKADDSSLLACLCEPHPVLVLALARPLPFPRLDEASPPYSRASLLRARTLWLPHLNLNPLCAIARSNFTCALVFFANSRPNLGPGERKKALKAQDCNHGARSSSLSNSRLLARSPAKVMQPVALFVIWRLAENYAKPAREPEPTWLAGWL